MFVVHINHKFISFQIAYGIIFCDLPIWTVRNVRLVTYVKVLQFISINILINY